MRREGPSRTTALLAIVTTILALTSVAVPALAGGQAYRAFTADSYWNTPLPLDAPRHADSDRIISFLKQDNVQDGCVMLMGAGSDTWGNPVYWADRDDPTYDIVESRWSLPDAFDSLRIPRGAQSSRNSDAELVIFDRVAGTVAWLWDAVYDQTNDSWSAGAGSISYLGSNGLDGRLPESDEPRNGGSQRGLNGAVTAVRYDEATAGAIEHVLKIAVNTARSDAIFPMIRSDGTTDHVHAPPQGTRMRIKPSVDLSRFDLHPQAQVIARALQDYGAVVGDSTGAPVALKLEDTVAQGRGQLWQLTKQALCSIPIEAFEVIDHTYRPPAGATAPSSTVEEPVEVERLSGATRIETAVEISRIGWDTSETVIIARSDDPADALAGSALAASMGAPLLVAGPEQLQQVVADEIRRLGASQAVLLGGTAALSGDLEAAVQRLGPEVQRVQGATRIETAALIADRLRPAPGGTAFLVGGAAWQDALAVAGLTARDAASGEPRPLLLTGGTLSDATKQVIDRWQIEEIVAVGSRDAVPDAVLDALRNDGRRTTRVGSSDPYHTSRAVADLDLRRGASELVIATGERFPDGLAAGAFAGRRDAVLVLVPDALDGEASTWLDGVNGIRRVSVAGGPVAVSDAVVRGVVESLG